MALLPPMIYVVFVSRTHGPRVHYFADSLPDECAMHAYWFVARVVVKEAYLRYD